MCDQSYPFPQVFLVDRAEGPQHSGQLPNLVPCWSFPPAQERVRSREKSRGYMGVSPGLAMVVLCLFLLVFAALGFEFYQIYNLKTELKNIKRTVRNEPESETPQKQIGLYKPGSNGEDTDKRAAAHVIGQNKQDGSHKTLRWEPKAGRAFTVGGVSYRIEDGALQVNETGLYHIYSRVEFIFKHCIPEHSFSHSVFVRRAGHPLPLKLMEAHREGCSQQKGNPWTTDSYLGSALQLQKYDRVLVNVSHPLFLSSHHANFFGLYQIQRG
ncbi:tumor necrosis factor ligand superfamily member 6 [Scomber japonicus]|uniref:tumor necrosis factor ligand superfamily member 6 n=1 Tax=Scomber japonicus TaxID=13676 RepID=UPI002304D3A6|nr:tumor necrosis factor ligand superfamily member 6 [Scomber japonicus]